jgi:hypothetical protein
LPNLGHSYLGKTLIEVPRKPIFIEQNTLFSTLKPSEVEGESSAMQEGFGELTATGVGAASGEEIPEGLGNFV